MAPKKARLGSRTVKRGPAARGGANLLADDQARIQAVGTLEEATCTERATVALHIWTNVEDLATLHGEVERQAAEINTDVPKFLDATGFWETPHRARSLATFLAKVKSALDKSVLVHDAARRATDAELKQGGTTSSRYLQQLLREGRRAAQSETGWSWLDRDKTSVVTHQTEAAARRAAAAALDAVAWAAGPRRAGTADERRALVLCRPPGHHNGCDERLEAVERHAWRFAAHGGCIFNETAVAIRNIQARWPTARAVVLDLDAHFGDGTAWSFYEDADVLCISMHIDQSDAHVFPYLKGKALERGAGKGAARTVNLPLLPGMGDAEAWRMFVGLALPAIQEHRPDILCFSLGFDGLAGDPSEAQLKYSALLYEHIVAACCSQCRSVVCTLQGGYLPDALAEAVEAVVRVLSGQPPSAALAGDVGPGFAAHLEQVKRDLDDQSNWWSYEKSFDYVPDGFVVEEDRSAKDVADG